MISQHFRLRPKNDLEARHLEPETMTQKGYLEREQEMMNRPRNLTPEPRNQEWQITREAIKPFQSTNKKLESLSETCFELTKIKNDAIKEVQ